MLWYHYVVEFPNINCLSRVRLACSYVIAKVQLKKSRRSDVSIQKIRLRSKVHVSYSVSRCMFY